MDLNIDINQLPTGPSIYTDLGSLDNIRKQAQVDSAGAIKAAAKEFEAFFMKMMLKSMRQASEVIGEDSPFTSQQEKMYMGMFDEQLSVELSQKGTLGIADLMTKNILGSAYQTDKIDASLTRDPFSHLTKVEKSVSNPLQVITRGGDLTTNMAIDKPQVSLVHEYVTFNSENKELKFKQNHLNNTPNTNIPLMDVNDSVKPLTKPAEKKALFESPIDFVKQLYPMAKKSAESLGVNPKILLAQAALETGWGKYVMHSGDGKASHNLFGIKSNKSWQGDSVVVDTLEVEKGQFKSIKATFKMYQNFEKSFDDYVSFIKENPRYKQALEVVDDVAEYLSSLQSAGYATDPNYASKILSIFNRDVVQDAK